MEKMERLIYAKKAVQDCLNNADTCVDMHGLSYWAKVVEDLREEIKKEL